MSMRYPGGLIATTPVNQQYPSGVWTGPQSAPYQANNVWANDSSFKNTTLLLHGDGATTPFIKDASTNNFQLTIVGDTKPNNLTPFITDGYWSNYFNGSSYLSLADNTAFDFAAGDFTIEAWVNFSSVSQEHMIASQWPGASNRGWVFTLDASASSILFAYTTNGTTQINASGTYTYTANTWYHIVACRSGANLRLFINGAVITTYNISTNTIYNSTASMLVGAFSGGSTPIYGYMSNFRIVKGTAVYTTAFTPPTSPLTAISGTSLLTCQSNRFVDNSSNAFSITANGSPSVSMQQPFTAPSGTSLYGSGYFDGTGDYITTPTGQTPLILGTSDFTIEMWAYPTTQVRGNPSLFTSDPGIGLANAILVQFSGTTGQTALWVNNTNLTASSTTNYIKLNQWNHVAVVRSGGSTYALYINGVAVNNVATNSTSLTTSNWYIGYWTVADNAYTGNISNFRIVNGTAVYTGAFTPPTAPLTPITNTALLTLQTNGPATNNGFLDSSYNSFPVTRNGNTTQGSFSPYGTNWSNYFDGSSHLTTASSASLQAGTGAFTIEGWINIVGTTTSGSILSQAPDVAGGYGVALVYSSGANTLSGVITTTSTPSWSASITPVKGVWYHVALVRDASTNIALFINGVKITPTTGGSTNTTNITAFNYFVSGSYFPDNPSRVNFRLNGYVSNARFVKGSAVYDPTAASITVPTAQLTAVTNTQLLILQANRIYDGSSNAFAITYSGTQSIGRFSPFPASLQYGTQSVGGSGYFDGSGDYLSVPDSDAFWIQGDFTFEAWVYQTSAKLVTIIGQLPISGNASFVFRIESSGKVSFFYQLTGGAGSNGAVSTSSVGYNVWNHIVWTRSGTTFKYFINGVQDATTQTISGTFQNGTGPVNIGLYNTGADTYMNGYISDARFVNGTALYSSNFTPPTSPLPVVAQTSLLCNFNNAAIFDNSGIGDLETVGDAKVSTAVTKYGTGSMYFDGSGDWLFMRPNVANDFGTGDFTIEMWIYPTATIVDYRMLLSIASTTSYITLRAGGTGGRLEIVGDSGLVAQISLNNSVALNTWAHLAVVRVGTTFTVYVNGISLGTATSSSAFNLSLTSGTYVGRWGGGTNYEWVGYIDDLRITKGVARYVTNFTPPVARMPNQ